MQLTEGHKVILERIHQLERPSTPDLKSDEEVLNHYSPSSVGKTLRDLAGDGYINTHNGRPNTYSLTDDGFNLVKHRRDKRKRRLKEAVQPADTLEFQDAVDAFEGYFRIDEVEDQLIQRTLAGEAALIKYPELERVETQLADEVLDNPLEMIEAAETALTMLSSIDGEPDVRFTDLPEYREKQIRKINTNDIGKLVTVPGVVMKSSVPRPVLVSAVFECTACGDRVEKSQRDQRKLTSPYKCDCGNRKFETVEKSFDDVLVLKLQEKPDSPDQKPIKVRVYGAMATADEVTELKPGTAVRLTGVVEAEAPTGKNDPYYKRYIRAIDISPEQNKWDEVELTDVDRERNQEILEAGPIRVFQNSVAIDRVIHRELMKEAFLLFLLGKSPTGNLHVLAMGEPGTGKSQLMNWAEEHLPKTIKASATGSSVVGLTATVTKDEDFGGYVAQGGSLTLADGGYHITDEFDKLDEEQVSCFNDALQDGKITLNKGDIVNLKLDANVSEWASANPRQYDYFDPTVEKYKQIPIHPKYEATRDRFDVIIAVTEYGVDTSQKRDVVQHILRRDRDDYEGTVPEYEAEALVKYITEASRLSPVMTDAADAMLEDVYFSLLKQQQQNQHLITNRGVEALKRLATAYARVELSEEITETHAEQACDFFRRSLESIDFEIGKDSFSDIHSRSNTDTLTVKAVVERLTAESDDDAAAFDDICTETDLAEDRVHDVLTHPDNEKTFYNPKGDLWRVL